MWMVLNIICSTVTIYHFLPSIHLRQPRNRPPQASEIFRVSTIGKCANGDSVFSPNYHHIIYNIQFVLYRDTLWVYGLCCVAQELKQQQKTPSKTSYTKPLRATAELYSYSQDFLFPTSGILCMYIILCYNVYTYTT